MGAPGGALGARGAALLDTVEAIDQGAARKPARLTRSRRNASISAALRASFQHLPSNTADRQRRKRRNSAIRADQAEQLQIRPDRDQVEQLEAGRTDRAGAKNAKTFAAPRQQETAGRHLDDVAAKIGRISTGQNNRKRRNSAANDQRQRGGSKLEPVWNCDGTTNPLIDKMD